MNRLFFLSCGCNGGSCCSGPGKWIWIVLALIAAFVWGVLIILLSPCTFAYMAPILAVSFKLASTNLTYGVLLLLFYGVSHCAVIVLAGTFTEVVQHYQNWNEKSKVAVIVKKVVVAFSFFLADCT